MSRQLPSWHLREELPLTAENLRRLLDNEIPAIRIPGFATAAECHDFAAAMAHANVKLYSLTPVGYIGMAQIEYRWGRQKGDYFAAVPDAYRDQRFVFDRSFDPVERLIGKLAEVWDAPVQVAREEEYGDYFAGIIRLASKGIGLHADYAPFNTPGYAIDRITAQLGWNLFVEASGSGGVTTVHHAPWTPAMDGTEPPQSYGLSRDAVAGAESFQYRPAAGDVVLFNSRNPHEVSAAGSDAESGRLQVGSFIGRMPDQTLVLWA